VSQKPSSISLVIWLLFLLQMLTFCLKQSSPDLNVYSLGFLSLVTGFDNVVINF
jgi:hypothetical protein